MKKLLIVIWSIVLVLAVASVGLNLYIDSTKNVATDSAPEPEETPKSEPKSDTTDGIVTFSVTAVGDCTLATDSNMRGSRSFVSEVKNQKDDYSYFFQNVKKYFEDDDMTIVNFEGVLSDRGSRQPKQYAFRGDPKYIKIISDSSVEAANLANNHTKDYGDKAFKDTKNILATNNVTPFGLDEYAITYVNGLKIGLIGTNALNHSSKKEYPQIFEQLKKENPNLIIAVFHWGEELAKVPGQSQIQLAHDAIDNGADLVIGHHPHVVQGIEKYNGKYIVYSLGNFCFGGNHNPSDKDSMIFKQTFTFENGKLLTDVDDVSVIPCSISSEKGRNNYQPTPLDGKEFKRVRDKIKTRSKKFEGIENIRFIKNKEL